MTVSHSWSPEILTEWVDQMAAKEKWMALFHADPLSVVYPAAVEVVGVTYSRQESLWLRAGATILELEDGLVWESLPPGTVVAAVGAFEDAFDSDSFLFRDMLPEPITYHGGGTYVLPAGEFTIGFDL